MPNLKYHVIKDYDAEVLANDWKAKRTVVCGVFADGWGIDVIARVSDKNGKYAETAYSGLRNPLEFAMEFRKVNATEKDIGYRAETKLVNGELEIHVGIVTGQPTYACSKGECKCEEDPV